MVTLQEMFDDLAMGVLANLPLVDHTTQRIKTTSYAKVTSYVNLALTALYKRFLLRVDEVVIQLHRNMTRYPLRVPFAYSNIGSTEPIKFIVDTFDNPFKADIIKIESVYSELGENFPINDSHQHYPIFTPEFDVVTALPTGDMPQALWIKYRARFPKLVVESTDDPETIQLNITDAILDALYARIAAQAYKGINGEESETSASRSYEFKYELECKRLEIENVLANDNNSSAENFRSKGWI